MSRRKLYLLATLIAGILSVYGLLAGGQRTSAESNSAPPPIKASKVEVSTAVKFDVSPPLTELIAQQEARPQMGPYREIPEGAGLPLPSTPHNTGMTPDSLIQKFFGPGAPAIPTPILSFDGIPNNWGVAPPDTDGDVSANYYVQMVNLGFQIYDKTGTALTTIANNNTLWSGFGGPCQTENAGDPVVLYDQLADRWMFTQFTDPTAPFFNCVALSTTGDPRGPYYRYAFSAPTFPDYPKYSVWPDAYYLNTRESGLGILGNYALERAEMLVGNPAARSVRITVPEAYAAGNGLLPSDLDGTTLPPAGSPAFFVGTQDDGGGLGAPSDAINIYKYHVDWVTPANSTFTGPTTLPVDPFVSTPSFCSGRSCVPQPGTTNKIDMLSYRQRPTFRLAYRNFGDHESLVTNQSVEAPVGMAGIRWYEIRDPNGTPTIYQQGTYSPGATDGIFRWMGSIAQDHMGNMALGYSASSSTLFPSVRYTGRLATDPLGTMPQGEASIMEGTGSETGGGNRWGDYSAMVVDPSDDCTFWYTQEYVPTTSDRGWRGRIGSFKFPNCVPVGGTATPTPTGGVATATSTNTVAATATRTNTVLATATRTNTVAPSSTATRTNTAIPPSSTPSPGGPTSTPTACSSTFNTTGSIDASDPAHDGYVDTQGNPKTCDAPATCPGVAGQGTGTWRYDIYPLTNHNSTAACITVVLDGTNCGTNGVLSTAYLGSYDPNDLCNNYLADTGINPVSGPVTYSFTVPAGATFYVEVEEYTEPQGCASYGLTVSGLGSCTTSTPTVEATATPTTQATAIATSTACTITFTDVPPDSPFYAYIRCLACRGIISGYGDGSFLPGNDITRGQIAKMVSNAAGFTEDPGPQVYEDVDSTNPFYQWINRLSNRGFIGGYPCGTIDPEPCVPPGNLPYFRTFADTTRGQLSKIVANAAGVGGTPTGLYYTDVPEDNPFYLWIMRLTNIGVMSGYDCGGPGEPCDDQQRPYFRPFTNVTRGQASKIVANTFFPDCQTPSRR